MCHGEHPFTVGDQATPSQYMTILNNRHGKTLFAWSGSATRISEAAALARRSYITNLKAICLAFGTTDVALEDDLEAVEARPVRLPGASSFGIDEGAIALQLARFSGCLPVFDIDSANQILTSVAHADRACLEAMARGLIISVGLPVAKHAHMIVLNPAQVSMADATPVPFGDVSLTDALRLLALTCLGAQAGATGRHLIQPGCFRFPIQPGSATAQAAALAHGPRPPQALHQWLKAFD